MERLSFNQMEFDGSNFEINYRCPHCTKYNVEIIDPQSITPGMDALLTGKVCAACGYKYAIRVELGLDLLLYIDVLKLNITTRITHKKLTMDCPFCLLTHSVMLMHEKDKRYVSCQQCEARGPSKRDGYSAILAWNREAK